MLICSERRLRIFVAVTILLAMSVYQVIVSNKLPSTSHSVPLIGQHRLSRHFITHNDKTVFTPVFERVINEI